MGSIKKKRKRTKKTSSSSKKVVKRRHSKYVKSFTRKDGIYVKGHYRQVGGKRKSK